MRISGTLHFIVAPSLVIAAYVMYASFLDFVAPRNALFQSSAHFNNKTSL